jgi:GLPGLI family protein
MKKIFATGIGCLLLVTAMAQTQFIAKGKIEYERRVNLHKILDMDEDGSWKEMMKKSVPPVKTSYFDLLFDQSKTLYKPGRDVVTTQKIPEWIEGPANDNIVLTNLAEQSFSSQKTVFESTFNISDSLRKMDWKITQDTRTIAGFECRKATAIIMDSVFVFAFYTDQILTHGGPESFQGLPGMILGIAIPRMHTTWFATKLELTDIKENIFIAPKKGKKTTISDLHQTLQGVMKNWGKRRDQNMWQVFI